MSISISYCTAWENLNIHKQKNLPKAHKHKLHSWLCKDEYRISLSCSVRKIKEWNLFLPTTNESKSGWGRGVLILGLKESSRNIEVVLLTGHGWSKSIMLENMASDVIGSEITTVDLVMEPYC